MAKLINGNGNKAIWAAQDADLIAALAGNVTGIAKVGNKFVATQEDANTIGLSDGVIVTKEGRRIQLDAGSVDLFDIPTGTAGVTSYYIIGYHLITNSDSSQTCETFVQKMDNATDVITENTFRGGATEIYVSCYRVVQDGLNIDSINALLPELENISILMSALTASYTLGTEVDITSYTSGSPYTPTRDGLLLVGAGTSNGASYAVKHGNKTLCMASTVQNGYGGLQCFELRKGISVYGVNAIGTGGSLKFIPYVTT